MNDISRQLITRARRARPGAASGWHARRMAIGAAALLLVLSPLAIGACKIQVLAELHVSTAHDQVMTKGLINGRPARIAIDTGADFTYVPRSAAQRLGLPVEYLGRLQIFGVGGQARTAQTVLKRLQIGTMYENNMQVIVLGALRSHARRTADLVLGSDMFSRYDSEFDLAHGRIRLLQPTGCSVDQLPYWTQTYSQAELQHGGFLRSPIETRVVVNGEPVDAILDSGAQVSIISRQAAERAGVKPWIKDPHPNRKIVGLGGEVVPAWVGRFDSFSIGDETIRHVPLAIADLFGADRVTHTGSRIAKPIGSQPDMLIGIDFFLAHHLLVLRRQNQLLFTYNGGKVFRTLGRRRVSAREPAPQRNSSNR